jgi:hypothetical protein
MGAVTEYIVDQPHRVFQMWQYGVGMKRLLIRSTKNDTFASRIDVLFQNVKAMKVPTLLHGLVVVEADPDQVVRISKETGLLPDRETIIFSVRSPAYDGYIVAGVCVQAEDEGEYYDPSQLWQDP